MCLAVGPACPFAPKHICTALCNAAPLIDSFAMATRTPSTDAKQTWVALSPNTECDAGGGEVYRSQSPGILSNIAACKKSCEDVAECKSITFFSSGWCSHFSTECTATKPTSKAMSMRLERSSGPGPRCIFFFAQMFHCVSLPSCLFTPTISS